MVSTQWALCWRFYSLNTLEVKCQTHPETHNVLPWQRNKNGRRIPRRRLLSLCPTINCQFPSLWISGLTTSCQTIIVQHEGFKLTKGMCLSSWQLQCDTCLLNYGSVQRFFLILLQIPGARRSICFHPTCMKMEYLSVLLKNSEYFFPHTDVHITAS